MRKKILLFKIFLLFAFSLTSVNLHAQTKKAVISATDSARLISGSIVNQVVQLPYNQSVPAKLTAATTSPVYHDDLVKAPVTNVLNALTGRVAGLYTLQGSGQPGFDGVSLNLRGRTPLILIDGVPRNLTTMSLEEIESVTVLKGAMATSLLGVRGANGAVLITTRKGISNQTDISFTVQSGFQQALTRLKPLGAFDYATLRNEAINNELSVNPNFNPGLRYTATDLQLFQDQTDPYGHPDVSWQDQVLKARTPMTRYSLNLSGGTSTIKYFTALEHIYQDGLLRTDDNLNPYNTNDYLSGYLIRSNIDIKVSPKISAGINIMGSIYNENEPGSTSVSIFNAFTTTPGSAYPVYNPNLSFAGTSQFPNNIQAQSIGSGYQINYTRNVLADFYVKRLLDDITPGLYVKAALSTTSFLVENLNRSKPVTSYQRFVSSAGVESYGSSLNTISPQTNSNSISSTTGVGSGQYRQSYFELATGWDRTFNKVHGINITALANSDSKFDGANLAYTVKGLSGRGAYNYKQKYVLELAAAYNGSNYYPTDSHYKYGFFPVVGLGWEISRENFMQGVKWLSYLKLSGSYGQVGNDNPGYFAYIQRFFNGTTPYFGTSFGANTSLVEQTLANPAITFEKANELDIKLNGSLFKNKLSFGVNYYDNKFSDVLLQRGQNTSILGNNYPNENIGRNEYYGMEFDLSWQQPKTKDIGYFIAFNAGLQQSKLLYSNEVTQPYPWMQRTGQKVNQAFGYVAQGFFQDQNDITNAKQNGVGYIAGFIPQPGDIKYLDKNGDGVINQFDQVPIGPTGPLVTFGANLGFSYKQFDVSALFQGVANYSVYLNGNSYWEFQNNGYGQAYQQQLNRWTPATAATATYPRLSIGSNVNNETFSTFWYRRADFVRLKNLQAGFTLPYQYAKVVKLKSIKIFATGTNLFTLTKLTDGLDPENYNGAYPIQRVLMFGVNIKL